MKTFDNEDFSMMPSIDGEYYNLYFCGKKIYQDSACEDLYDEETAYDMYNELIDGLTESWESKVKAAITKGFEPSLHQDVNDIEIDAESYLIQHTDDEDCKVDIVEDFWKHPSYIEWFDSNGVCCCSAFGEIVDNDYRNWSYYRYTDGKLTPAKFYDREDADVYCYLDKVVDTNGDVWILIA